MRFIFDTQDEQSILEQMSPNWGKAESIEVTMRLLFSEFQRYKVSILVFGLLLLSGLTGFAQPMQTVEVRMQDLPAIQRQYGTDSVRQLVNATPIWLLNQGVALALLQAPDISFADGGWERRYLLKMAQDVQAPELVPLLEGLLRTELRQAEQVNQRSHFVLSLDDDLLLAYLHQQPVNAEVVLTEQLNRYTQLRQQIESGPRTNFFLRLLGQDLVTWSKTSVEGTIYYYLLALHSVNPTKFPLTRLEEQRNRVTVRYITSKSDRFQPGKAVNYRTEQVKREEIQVNGLRIPKALADNGLCRLIKITTADDTYFLEQSCQLAPRAGSGNTYLVRTHHDLIEITYVHSWIS